MALTLTTSRRVSVIALSLFIFTVPSCQQKQSSPPHETANAQPQAAPSTKPRISIYHVDGVVTRTNPNYPSIELNHEEIPGHMNAMIMEWYVKDVSLLTSIKPGDKVEFTLEITEGGSEIIKKKKKRNGENP